MSKKKKKKKKIDVASSTGKPSEGVRGTDTAIVEWARETYRNIWNLSAKKAEAGGRRVERKVVDGRVETKRVIDEADIDTLSLLQFFRRGKVSRRTIFVSIFVALLAVYGLFSLARGFVQNSNSSTAQDGAYGDYAQQAGGGSSGGGGGCCGGGNQQEIKKATTVKSDYQEIKVQVQNGYNPNTIEAKKGLPLKITFARQSQSGCDRDLVFPELDIYETLPDDGEVTLDIPIPSESGKTIQFTCGMGMLSGKIVVKD